MKTNPDCRDCGVEMHPGFVVDFGDHGVFRQSRWADGEPRKGWLSEVKGKQASTSCKVTTFRCPKCGLLDSYAFDLNDH